MSKVLSPLLKNRIENGVNHEVIYQNLKNHANDVKPNKPKARLVRQNIVQKVVDPIGDTFVDGKNFFKAAATGQLNDHQLGRINDLGMKAGALLIASFLATTAKTKTDAAMRFLGGTTFFATMALWPKLFINLPARLIHGFRIDHKYISAQGDKKELGLDNQFQPMDIFSDEEMLEMAKNAGIDPKDVRAKEKMQRKLQKTMLQNRTLWMATAGFATPLLTSFVSGSGIEPRLREAIIKHDYKVAENALKDNDTLNEYLSNYSNRHQNKNTTGKKGIISSLLSRFKKDKPDDIETMFGNSKTGVISDETYKKLAQKFSLENVVPKLKDSDDVKPLSNVSSDKVIECLKELREEKSTVSPEELKAVLKDNINVANVTKNGAQECKKIIMELKNNYSADNIANILGEHGIQVDKSAVEDLLIKNSSPKGVKTIIESLLAGSADNKPDIQSIIDKLNGDYTLKNIRRVLNESPLTAKNTNDILASIKADNSAFIKTLSDYSKTILPDLKNRTKAYLNLVNSIVGQKRESVYTQEYMDSFKNLFDILGIKDYKEIKHISELCNLSVAQTGDVNSGELSKLFSEKIQEYIKKDDGYVSTLLPKSFVKLGNQKTGTQDDFTAAREILWEYYNKLLPSKQKELQDKLGEHFYIAKNNADFANFIAYITPENKAWTKQIAAESVFYDSIKDCVNCGTEDLESLKTVLKSTFGEKFYLLQGDSLAKAVKRVKDNPEAITELLADFSQKCKNSALDDAINFDSKAFKDKLEYIETIVEEISKQRDNIFGKIKPAVGIEEFRGFLKDLYQDKILDKFYHKTLTPNAKYDFVESGKLSEAEQIIEKLLNKNTAGKVTDFTPHLKGITDSIIGADDDSSLFNVLKNYIDLQRINLASCKMKASICANFEQRVKDGEFSDLTKEQLETARQIVFDGTIARMKNYSGLSKGDFEQLIGRIYNAAKFEKEEVNCIGVQELIRNIKNTVLNSKNEFTKEYLTTGSFISLLKDHAVRVFENKAWKNIFVPMTLGLIAVTLLVQPLFGKIDKEFPENGKEGGNK